MKPELQKIELFLVQSIEDANNWILNSQKAEEQLIHQLMLAIESNLRVDSKNKQFAPNIFLLSLPPDSVEEIRSRQTNIEGLAKRVAYAGMSNYIQFRGPININIFPDENLKQDTFRVLAIWKNSIETEKVSPSPSTEQSTSDIAMAPVPPKAFLIVEGTKIFTLDQDITNIGRNIDNHLVLNDIRVSRNHAQIRVIKGRHMLFDLESSGGTFINNKRISKITLHPGDVISLAGIPLVYGQDAISFVDESNEYTPPNDVSDGSTTTMRIGYDSSDPEE